MSYVNNCSQNNKFLEGISREKPASLTLVEESYISLGVFSVISAADKGNTDNDIYIKTHHLAF